MPLSDIARLIDAGLKTSAYDRPVDIAMIRVLPEQLEFCAIGNVGVLVESTSGISVPLQDGNLGPMPPKEIRVHRVPRPGRFTAALHSDGLSLPHEFILDINSSADHVARQLYDVSALPDDDATIVVFRG
ncbi:hypothetical protein [Bacterioplanes sanyensis]|uniref:hypothetical protein n=1 Tax=Bacterioplanes sanyensis TaxID=1249553 RepID=UPI0012FE1292|nr:hypothetical protein [Bacterioplanes sanyensis]